MSFASFEPVIIFTLLNVVMALGLYITAMSGQLSMATAAIAGVGGYVSAILTVKFGWPFLLAILLAAVAGAVVGTLLALVTLKMRDFILKLTTLAFGEALAALAFNWDYIGGANSFTGIGLKTTIWTALAATGVALYVTWRFDGSRLGFASRAVRDDPIAASAMGISIAQMRSITFAVGGALVGMGGAIQGHYMLVISPHDLGFFVSLNFIIFLLFGGLQTMWGPVLGAVLLTALRKSCASPTSIDRFFWPHHCAGGAAPAQRAFDPYADGSGQPPTGSHAGSGKARRGSRLRRQDTAIPEYLLRRQAAE